MCWLCLQNGENSKLAVFRCLDIVDNTGTLDPGRTTTLDSGGTTVALTDGQPATQGQPSGFVTYNLIETTDAANSTATNYTLTVGQALQGHLSPANDSDWYRVNLVAGHTYTFAVAGEGALSNNIHDSLLYLRNASGVQLAMNDDGGPGLYSTITFTANTTGTYYLDVQSYGGLQAGQYGLSVTEGTHANYDVDMAAGAILTPFTSWASTPGTPVTVTFGFRQSAPTFAVSGHSTIASTFTELTSAEMAAVRTILQLWSDVSGVKFVEVNPGGYTNSASILFSNYSDPSDGSGAFSFYPSGDAQGGDVFLNLQSISTTSLTFGSYSFFAIMHEVGHAIGLSHPGDYNAAPGQSITYANNAQFIQDSQQYTVMSYFDKSATGAQFNGYAAAPMLFDIYATQLLYGANMTTRTGDTVYGFNGNAGPVFNFSTNARPAFAIWDAGGNDTLDCSGYSMAQTINLNSGQYSSIGGLTQNVVIAYGATIENAIGGSGADTVIGNDADNFIDGRAGADTMTGGLGNDTYVVDNVGDVVIEKAGQGTDTVRAGISYTLGANVENLSLTGVANINGTGNQLANAIVGNSGRNVLNGGGGRDVITGAAGADKFVFDSAAYADATATIPIVDHITDYDRGNTGTFSLLEGDQLDLTALLSTAYASGQAARTLVRIVENVDGTGALLQVDLDGTGTASHWTTLGQLDGMHLGQTVNVILSSSQPSGTTLTLQGNYALSGDFNGDGKADVLWRNDNGTNAVWFMNGGQVSSAPLLHGAGPDWHIVGTGDFNGDGKSDILWRNDGGYVAMWEMNGSQILSAPGVQGAGLDWHVAGTGDFNGDGKDDILWRNDNGSDAIWFMNGGKVSSATSIQGAGPDWHIIGTGDFNGDGKADILWRNDGGYVAMWEMNGSQILSAPGVQGAGLDWHVAGTGDFNGDGKDDILWRNDNGSNAIWFMNGGQLASASMIQGAGLDWHIVGTGDFNGDGKADIQWRNDSGYVALWEMNGAQILSTPGVQGASLDWNVATHHYDFV